MSTKYLKIICVFLIVIGVLASFISVFRRNQAENRSKIVSIVVDYDEVAAFAAMSGEDVDDILSKMKSEGNITHIALSEDTPNTLILSGKAFYDQSTMPPTFRFVNKEKQQTFDRKIDGKHIPSIYIADIGLGLDTEKIEKIERANLKVVPRLSTRVAITKEAEIKESFSKINEQIKEENVIIIFDGASILGNSMLLNETKNSILDNNFLYGSIEFGKQRGDSALGILLNGSNFLRVHSISTEEMNSMPNSKAIERFSLAIKDRNIRVLFVRFPQRATEDVVKDSIAYLADISGMVSASGFKIGDALPISMVQSGGKTYFLNFVAIFFACALFVLCILPKNLSKTTVVNAVIAGVFIVGIAFFLALHCNAPKIIAVMNLLAAIIFPLLALLFTYVKLRGLKEKTAFGVFMGYLFAACAIAFCGGVLIAANMSHNLYLNKIYQFSGIKVALVIPLLLFAAMVVTDAVAKEYEKYNDFCRRIYANATEFLSKPLFIWGALLAVVLLAFLAIMLMRSGNESAAAVSDFELKFRAILEKIMYARPRTKEFLVGFPAFILAFVAMKKGFKAAAQWLIIIGGIGIVDLVNTFCHAHTPFMISLIRSVNSMILGVIVAAVIYGIWLGIEKKSRAKELRADV